MTPTLVATASGTSSMAVPAAVQAGDTMFASYVLPGDELPDFSLPSGLGAVDAGENYIYALTQHYWGVLRPYSHDGRSSYDFDPLTPSARLVAAFYRGIDTSLHALVDPTRTAYPQAIRVRGLDAYADDHPSESPDGDITWGYYYTPQTPVDERTIFLGFWSQANESGDDIDQGLEIVRPITSYIVDFSATQQQVGYFRTYTGNVADPSGQIWSTRGWLINSGGLPPLRQNQRDDIRQGQRTSRQLTVRQRGYL